MVAEVTVLYQELIAAALATGRDQRRKLACGARLTVRFRFGEYVVSLSRRGEPILEAMGYPETGFIR